MQGKGIIKFFAILLAVVCLYQLSFTWVASKVEDDASKYAKGNLLKEKAYLDSMDNVAVYPVLGWKYQYVKEKKLALGLDLKGGMDVTMQVSLVELIKALANNNPDPAFNQALASAEEISKTNSTDFVVLFVREYERIAPNGKLAAIFSTKDNESHLKFNASDAQVTSYLQDQAAVAVTQAKTVLNTRIDQFGVVQPNIQIQHGNQILIELPGVSDEERVRKLLQGSANLEFYETFENPDFFSFLSNADKILAAKLKSQKTDTAKVASTAKATAAATDTSKKSQALSLIKQVQKAGKTDTSALAKKSQFANQNPLFAVLQPNFYRDQNGQTLPTPGPVVGYAAQKDTAKVNALLNTPEVKAAMPHNVKLLWDVKSNGDAKVFPLYAIKLTGADNGPTLSGDVISDARAENNQSGNPEVIMVMNSDGASKWRRITAEASKDPKNLKSIAIVLDNNVYSAPRVQSEIPGGISTISGSYTTEDTKDLANILKSGRLKAPVRIIGEEVVGASLGEEAIHAGLMSCVIGFVVVLIFMLFYYNRAGTVANVAVLVNVFFLMGVLASLNAVLTLPGIAGIVLTLGMAVDANVLIYERIREELGHGKSMRIAVADGFKHALSSILDSNISTFLTGLILYVFGSGPIRGFATTLMIGIVTSLFCSILISRLIFEWMLKKDIEIKLSNPWSSHTFKNANYQFVKNRFKFYIFSGLFITAGIVSMVTQGFNYGVDFLGGRSYVVKFEQPVPEQKVREVLNATFHKEPEVKTFGTDGHQLRITTTYLIDDNSANAEAKVRAELTKGLSQLGQTTIRSSEKVSPTIASDLKTKAIYAVLFAIVVISAYILVRFRKWQFSLGAMVATAHDALLVLSFFSIFKNIMPFSLDIDQAFIAAILTVIGYSINDTVVVFDRIREFLELHHSKTDNPKEVINQAINSTLSRTIITALTVIFVLLVLFFFGGDVIKGFSFALLIGVCFGTYSSICVATPVIIDFGKKDLR
ncbi:protein translocase subunit SecDF [Mucilaginibacter sp. PPCGB 2223]|uniref:protein translocase subunit SecDF n=1 Tax=Mucilaginibacter sp. PPCGB 2223 TaxID=1886027 RepID=UPI0008245582|nr:protein translocase subunit SecDF [Mucilaginibacter sp. PPCGB 2223]OCX51541.1 protein translocase subunit SecDF [Mucilaginibacter sp. PPCGB 2223]